MQQYDKYEITWRDACSGSEWTTPEELKLTKIVEVTEVAFLVHDDGITIWLASQVNDAGQLGNWTIIPKENVLLMTKIS